MLSASFSGDFTTGLIWASNDSCAKRMVPNAAFKGQTTIGSLKNSTFFIRPLPGIRDRSKNNSVWPAAPSGLRGRRWRARPEWAPGGGRAPPPPPRGAAGRPAPTGQGRRPGRCGSPRRSWSRRPGPCLEGSPALLCPLCRGCAVAGVGGRPLSVAGWHGKGATLVF